MDLAILVHRIATDPKFAAQISTQPETTLKQMGLSLEREEMRALFNVLRKPGSLYRLLKGLDHYPDDNTWA
jgi:hypothetical protein